MTQHLRPDDELVVEIHEQLRHLANITLPGPSMFPYTCEQIAELIDTAFWVSLRSDEGRRTRVVVTVSGALR